MRQRKRQLHQRCTKFLRKGFWSQVHRASSNTALDPHTDTNLPLFFFPSMGIMLTCRKALGANWPAKKKWLTYPNSLQQLSNLASHDFFPLIYSLYCPAENETQEPCLLGSRPAKIEHILFFLPWASIKPSWTSANSPLAQPGRWLEDARLVTADATCLSLRMWYNELLRGLPRQKCIYGSRGDLYRGFFFKSVS